MVTRQSSHRQQCQCACGSVRFSFEGPPLLRAYCHCQICQEFNCSARADIVLCRRSLLDLPADSPVDYRTYQWPGLVQRGRCRSCGKPAIEFLRMPLFPELAIIPSANCQQPPALPEASFHMFYHRRAADADDDLPRYSGYLGSQLGFLSHLLRALRAA